MNIINLTPHDVVFYNESGETTTFPRSGQLARVDTIEQEVSPIYGMPVNTSRFGSIIGLPEATNDTIYIVSMVVAQAASTRKDLVSPDTFKNAVRNEAGQIIGTRAWVRYC